MNLSQKSGLGDYSPLDLSVSHRKRTGNEEGASSPPQKITRTLDCKPATETPWRTSVTPQLPYLAGLSPKNSLHHQHAMHRDNWNVVTNDATKALEKMSELSRCNEEDIYRSPSSGNFGGTGEGGGRIGGSGMGGGGRHSAWQSHWLNKGADSAKDVLKCVWCKQSFPSLATMTTHMKETKHCGVHVPPGGVGGGGRGSYEHTQQPIPPPALRNNIGGGGDQGDQGHDAAFKPSPSELSMLLKETMPLPRKLVRGQDVWLGKGLEQTRQILKCMWCGQSFRTLAEMTAHMQETQHYTNIISQEQIISWKSSDSYKSSRGGGGASGPAEDTGRACPSGGGGLKGLSSDASAAANAAAAAQTDSYVSAVLTCKVCDQAFSSLKELSNHMVKNAHYKEHIMKPVSENGTRRRQTRERRKKSLPVRKYLETEQTQHDNETLGAETGPSWATAAAAAVEAAITTANKPLRDLSAGKISCEKCNEKIETTMFVEHIRQCIGGTALLTAQQQRGKHKNEHLSNTIISPGSNKPVTRAGRNGRKSACENQASPLSSQKSSLGSDIHSPMPVLSKTDGNDGSVDKKSSFPSVLNAIEQFVEKSFDSRSRHGDTKCVDARRGNIHKATPLGSTILKRLGIDESVDCTKPLVDPQTMNLLRSNHQHQQPGQYTLQRFGRHNRSVSESSSISERGSSRQDSLTPETKINTPSHCTPRGTPDKPFSENGDHHHVDGIDLHAQPPVKRDLHKYSDSPEVETKLASEQGSIRMKKEILHDTDADEHEADHDMRPPSKAQQREDRDDLDSLSRSSITYSPAPGPRLSTASVLLSPAASPISDPHSIASQSKSKAECCSKKSYNVSNSLGALSSMFDSLTGAGSNSTGHDDAISVGETEDKKSSAHPLAALQKLCDKTEKPSGGGDGHGRTSSSGLLAVATNNAGSQTASGSIMGFSWACNETVISQNVAGGTINCTYCDRTFSSKGAYRHHLSKVHFVNDDVIPDPKVLGGGSGEAIALSIEAQLLKTCSSSAPNSPKSTDTTAPLPLVTGSSGGSSFLSTSSTDRESVERRVGRDSDNGPSAKSPSFSQSPASDESPHSKFIKYTELAKQLSSKYV